MKELFEKLGFRKADEMERSIQLKSIRLAWAYTVVFLVVWSLYESYVAKRLQTRVNMLPTILLLSQNMVLIGAQLFLQKRMTGDDEEKKDTLGAGILMAAIVVVLVVLGALMRLMIG